MKRLYTLLALATVAQTLHGMDKTNVPLLEKTRLYPKIKNTAIQDDTRVAITDTFVSLAQQEEQLWHDYVEENKQGSCGCTYNNEYLAEKFYTEKKAALITLQQKNIALEQQSCTLQSVQPKKETIMVTSSSEDDESNNKTVTLKADRLKLDSVYTIRTYLGDQDYRRITHVNLSHNNLTALVLHKLIGACPNATDIDVSHNKIAHMVHIGYYTKSKLQKLNLSGNQLTHVDLEAFFEDLPLLNDLDLSHNPIRTVAYANKPMGWHVANKHAHHETKVPIINLSQTQLSTHYKTSLQQWYKEKSKSFFATKRFTRRLYAAELGALVTGMASLITIGAMGLSGHPLDPLTYLYYIGPESLLAGTGAGALIEKIVYDYRNKQADDHTIAHGHETHLIFDESSTTLATSDDL